jgi:hypothetical protein
VLEPAYEHDMAIEPTLSWRDLREGHANLERDACFLRQDDGRPDGDSSTPALSRLRSE